VPELVAEHAGILPNRACTAPAAALAHRAGARIAGKDVFGFPGVRARVSKQTWYSSQSMTVRRSPSQIHCHSEGAERRRISSLTGKAISNVMRMRFLAFDSE
jgi:hypothetical protein